MNKILTIVGAKPQFIKSAVISRLLNNYDSIKEIIVHTGQHYDDNMSQIFFNELNIPKPAYNLDVGSGTHAEQTSKMLMKIYKIIEAKNPDCILTYGDTNSTIAGALAGVKIDIPIVHVEAGLRSFDKNMPEEINRILTDHMSTILLTPSKTGVQNLKNEGFVNIINNGKLFEKVDTFHNLDKIDKNNPVVVNVGDIMYDSVLYSVEIAEERSNILKKLRVKPNDYYLATIHRAENTDNVNKFSELVDFINEISKNIQVIFPMHPRTKKVLDNYKDIQFNKNINIIEPVGYFDILKLMKNSSLLLTDSGGVQKEAYWLDTPCITLREQTEWVETVENKRNILYQNFSSFDYFNKNYNKDIYGEGKTGEIIVEILQEIIGE